ncbi:HAMP domain-containing sensor histidine kinase [Zhenhengia yiwuensis]|uniref:sensor histidine kinase n=1 Tax=Zhenhengia yiwuensis TaxID=2763666 RepID=UPI002A75A092|nr:HAMP domain-containing sensor histidine kinase [Zhenhengia yiwuensis]MDY3369500.1 HAMP domain-containing sensor histidine kinase [Zhenhengia yiwuensis]
MLKELRIQLTLICSTITGLILCVICLIALQISETNINKSNRIAFENQLQTITYQLQTYQNIKTSWLAQLEASNKLIISIEDNTHPLFFKGSWTPITPRDTLIQKAHQTALEDYQFDIDTPPTSRLSISKQFFKIQGDEGEYYRVGVALIPSYKGSFSLTLLQDMSIEKASIIYTRILFITISLMGILLLSLFSYWFAGRAILPITINQQKQVQFIAAASHELKSPLAVIQSNTSVIKSHGHLDNQPFIMQIEKECKRMARLVDDLLLLATADAKTWSIRKKPVELDTLLIEMLDTFIPLANGKRQRLNLNLPEYTLPPVLCDDERILQAITILLDNALHYVQEGGTITIDLSMPSDACIIKVIDNGPGISPSHVSHIFDRFYRVDASRKDKNHYGLGLSIAKEIIHLHSGKLSFSPTPGGGCTFIIELPT